MPHITFIRHGLAQHNVDALTRGECAYYDPINTDAALTEEGWEQAKGLTLSPSQFDVIYCSPSLRCRQTLVGALPDHGRVLLDDWLMEPQGDAFCNKRVDYAELVASLPPDGLWSVTAVERENPFSLLDESYASGEVGHAEFVSRVRSFHDAVLATYGENDRILVVSHHDWIRTWFREITGQNISPRNCEVLRAST